MVSNEKFSVLQNFLLDEEVGLAMTLPLACVQYNSRGSYVFDDLDEKISDFLKEANVNRFTEPYVSELLKLKAYAKEMFGWVILTLQRHLDLHNENIQRRNPKDTHFNYLAKGKIEPVMNKLLSCQKTLFKQAKDMQAKSTQKAEKSDPIIKESALTEKLLLIAFLQTQNLFPKYQHNGVFSKTAMFELIAYLLAEKPDTIKKSWNERVQKIMDNQATSSANRQKRLKTLMKVNEVLSKLGDSKLNKEIKKIMSNYQKDSRI